VRRQLRNEFRPLYDAIRLTLVLGVLTSPGSAGIAAAAAPVFQGIITSPTLCSPRGTAVAPGGGLFVGSDCSSLHHMEQFDAAGGLVASWGFTPRYLGPPNGVAIDGSGNVLVIDMFNSRLLKYTSSGEFIDSWNAGASPVDVAVDGFGDVFVADYDAKLVRKTTSTGVPLATFGGPGSTPGRFQFVNGVGVDASGRVYGADPARVRVVRFLADGTFDMEFAPPSPPADVAVGPDGNIYVVSFDSNQAYQYSSAGVLLQSFGSPLGLDQPFRIVIDSTGALFITEQYPNRVSKFQIDLVTPAMPLTFGHLKAIYR
jgi:DNA-binding beta-propeller fold protein YncE